MVECDAVYVCVCSFAFSTTVAHCLCVQFSVYEYVQNEKVKWTVSSSFRVNVDSTNFNLFHDSCEKEGLINWLSSQFWTGTSQIESNLRRNWIFLKQLKPKSKKNSSRFYSKFAISYKIYYFIAKNQRFSQIHLISDLFQPKKYCP